MAVIGAEEPQALKAAVLAADETGMSPLLIGQEAAIHAELARLGRQDAFPVLAVQSPEEAVLLAARLHPLVERSAGHAGGLAAIVRHGSRPLACLRHQCPTGRFQWKTCARFRCARLYAPSLWQNSVSTPKTKT